MTDTTQQTLKPCPFCGGEAQLFYSEYDASESDPIRNYVRVECLSGCVSQEDTVIGTRSWGKANWTYKDKENAEAKVIAAWNRRAGEEQ